MELRSYYWHQRVLPKPVFQLLSLLKPDPSRYFCFGNAGDIFARDLLVRQYSCRVRNLSSEGNRLLAVGSISHMISQGDVICGIGYKGSPPPEPKDNLVWALRGPITYEAFKKKGYDLSNLKFLYDPGLYIRFMVKPIKPETNRVLFLPHYRERFQRKTLPEGLTFANIDQSPITLADEIMRAEHVYTSSLHGVIFSHALGRPCTLIKPQTTEPLIKYTDYFASIDQPFLTPLDSIDEINYSRDSHSPLSLQLTEDSFSFPKIEDLIQRGVVIA